MELEIGQKIIAIDPCVMFGSQNEALKVGKEYEIKAISKSSITIQSEEAVNHTFYLDELYKFFEL